jgi:hypothetical protein
MSQMTIPFPRERVPEFMVRTLWNAAPGPSNDQRMEQVTSAMQMTAKANPTIRGEALFFLTLDWLKASKVRA